MPTILVEVVTPTRNLNQRFRRGVTRRVAAPVSGVINFMLKWERILYRHLRGAGESRTAMTFVAFLFVFGLGWTMPLYVTHTRSFADAYERCNSGGDVKFSILHNWNFACALLLWLLGALHAWGSPLHSLKTTQSKTVDTKVVSFFFLVGATVAVVLFLEAAQHCAASSSGDAMQFACLAVRVVGYIWYGRIAPLIPFVTSFQSLATCFVQN